MLQPSNRRRNRREETCPRGQWRTDPKNGLSKRFQPITRQSENLERRAIAGALSSPPMLIYAAAKWLNV
jgi:hypothetical protein